MIRQTYALLVDAYRELNASKLFWIVLAISLLVAGAFACVGINERGITLLFWEIHSPFVNSRAFISQAFFYKFLFFYFGFQFWLTWAATILALISTASIIPDFVSGGAIDLVLSKPIGRIRLFITKYFTSLLFVTIQVSLFTAAAFLVIGLRGKVWLPVVFVAIPLVLALFSYLYAISASVGLITRSPIASLLIAGLFWFFVFLVQAAEQGFLQERITQEQSVAIIQNDLTGFEGQLEKVRARSDEEAAAHEKAVAAASERVEDAKRRLNEAETDEAWWRRMHAWAFGLKTVMPKTAETMRVLERSLLSMGELDQFASGAEEQGQRRFPMGQTVHGVRISQKAVQRQLLEETRSRTSLWAVGTSLFFEAAVLAIAAWIFARRDF
jgi:hypothetical protein